MNEPTRKKILDLIAHTTVQPGGWTDIRLEDQTDPHIFFTHLLKSDLADHIKLCDRSSLSITLLNNHTIIIKRNPLNDIAQI